MQRFDMTAATPHPILTGTVFREWHRLACCASATS